MQRMPTVGGLTMLAASLAFAQDGWERERVEQELRRLNEEAAQMQVRNDVATARRLLADDYLFLQADGQVSNKAQNIAVIQDPMFVCESFVTKDVQIRQYGEVAVITGRAMMRATYKGREVGGDFLYTDVWVKRQGHWQTVVSQATRIPRRP